MCLLFHTMYLSVSLCIHCLLWKYFISNSNKALIIHLARNTRRCKVTLQKARSPKQVGFSTSINITGVDFLRSTSPNITTTRTSGLPGPNLTMVYKDQIMVVYKDQPNSRPYYKKTYAIGQNVRQVLIIVGHVSDTIKKKKKKKKKPPISYHILDGAQASCLYSAVYEKNEVLKLCT